MHQHLWLAHAASLYASGGHERGIIDKIIDAIVRGFGWQIGKNIANVLTHVSGPVGVAIGAVVVVGLWWARRQLGRLVRRVTNILR